MAGGAGDVHPADAAAEVTGAMEPTHSFEVVRSSEFGHWFERVKDPRARAAIETRIRRMRIGNFGDCRSVGGRVSEMRVDVGQGYRVYFVRVGDVIVVLLCGGDKSSQRRDIATANRLAEKAEEIVNGT